ncbi:hypothetical protein PoB_004142400 [Plakobranchus ocellatus]|uniref:Uncharacterized protein n=1 Tax=Plakobranchus ocellatus TaxID=259542 RepID=A0AAV4B898_9GAST|nr:hypothetical protein PoB_004142400 [Plakobranchus ocellatus]
MLDMRITYFFALDLWLTSTASLWKENFGCIFSVSFWSWNSGSMNLLMRVKCQQLTFFSVQLQGQFIVGKLSRQIPPATIEGLNKKSAVFLPRLTVGNFSQV